MEQNRFGSSEKRTRRPANHFPLIRTQSRAAFIIRLISRIMFGMDIAAIIILIIFARLSLPIVIIGTILLATSALTAWLINSLAEPFEHLRNCSDAILNIEAMMARDLREQGISVKEEYH